MSYFAKGTFEVTNAHIPDGESWYIVGSAPELGGWDACRGLKLDRGHDGVWRGTAYIYNVWNTVCPVGLGYATRAAVGHGALLVFAGC
jgi:hypothetical protein